jgi:hypothetical protein
LPMLCNVAEVLMIHNMNKAKYGYKQKLERNKKKQSILVYYSLLNLNLVQKAADFQGVFFFFFLFFFPTLESGNYVTWKALFLLPIFKKKFANQTKFHIKNNT